MEKEHLCPVVPVVETRIGNGRFSPRILIPFLFGFIALLICFTLLQEANAAIADPIDSAITAPSMPEFRISVTDTVPLSPFNPWTSSDNDNTSSVAWGDMDGDGDLDLAVANAPLWDGNQYVGGANKVYLNEGGVLQTTAAWGSSDSDYTTNVAWGDMDGDGDLDLAVANIPAWDGNQWVGGANKVYFNEGGMLQATAAWASSDSDRTTSVAWGDMDGDGDLDLAVANEPLWDDNQDAGGANKVYLNEGGLLQTIAEWASGDNDSTTSVAWGDMDGDGDLDLAVANIPSWDGNQYMGGANKVYLNEGGMLQTTADWVSDDWEFATSVAWGDMDGDGDLDLAVANAPNWDGNQFIGGANKVYLNEGGVLQTTAAWASNDTDLTHSVAWGDVDSDGDLDLAVGNGQSSANKVYLNEGGMLQITAAWTSINSDATLSVAWGDMDGDGDLDLAIGNSRQANIVYLNEGEVLQTTATWVSYEYWDETLSVAWGDMDGDGDLDLAAGNRGTNRVYQNEGGEVQTIAAWNSSDWDMTTSVAWGDMDGDGDLDLAVANAPFWDGNEYMGGANKVYLNEGGMLQTLADWVSDDWDSTTSVAWGDMDGDGDLDLAVANEPFWDGNQYVGGTNKVYLNEGGILQTTAAWASSDSDYTTSVAWGDVDGDGDLDLAVGNKHINSNKMYLNEGGVLQTTAIWISADKDWTESVAWADVDGDGDLDLAAGNAGANKVYLNEGGELQTTAAWTSGDSDYTMSVAWGDVDGDGDLDLAVGNNAGSNKVYLNDGSILQTAADTPWYSNDNDNTSSVAWGDMDGDGDLDLAVANVSWDGSQYVDGTNKVYRNKRFGGHVSSFIATSQPLAMAAANYYASAQRLDANHIPIPYTLFHQQGVPVGQVKAFYSPDGGGQWFPAVAASGTVTTGLPSAGIDTFDPTLSATLWQTVSNGTVSTGLCGGAGGSAGLTFDGNGERSATTVPLDVAGQTILHFDLIIGSGSPSCDKAETGEEVILQYSLDSIAWTTLAVYDVDSFTTTRSVSATLPISPQTTSAQFRWSQPNHDGDGFDNWAIDNVLIPARISHTYVWDTFASGFFGQSDNVVLRFVAAPQPSTSASGGTYRYPHLTTGPILYGSASATTFPFRVRGTQVRVISGTLPVGNAVVYHLPKGQHSGATAMSSQSGLAYLTDNQGYLQGRGQLELGDQIIALSPITHTDAYTLYYTSAPISITGGLVGHEVAEPGVQTLYVSPQNPLILFNIDVALEWDATQDGSFLNDLTTAVNNASRILYDVSNGQMAIGDVNLTMNKENWIGADVIVYAQNGIRPRATMGGVVNGTTNDIGLTGIITNAYGPGQIKMGPNWDPFGSSLVELSTEWYRAFAHELAHYLLYLPDNYIGMENGRPISTDCFGSFMTSTYDDLYSEFLIQEQWDASPDCAKTMAQATTGRTDWETIQNFYAWVIPPTGSPFNLGPDILPLQLVNLTIQTPASQRPLLDSRIIELRDKQTNQQLAVPRAQAYLYQTQATADLTDDRIIPLGSVVSGSFLKLRGAAEGDKLCVFGPTNDSTTDGYLTESYAGCIDDLTATSRSLFMEKVYDWQPGVKVQSVTSRTMAISVTLPIIPTEPLYVQVYPAYGDPNTPNAVPIAPIQILQSADGLLHTTQVTLPHPAFEGLVRVWISGTMPVQESLSAIYLSPPWGPDYGGGGFTGSANARAYGSNGRLLGAPVASGDGQVTIFVLEDIFADTGTISLQAINNVPNLDAWLTPVGQGYRLFADTAVTETRVIAFDYLQREVPVFETEEDILTLYYSPDDGQSWQRLPTDLDVGENRATAVIPANGVNGQGIYVLAATFERPTLQPGWNAFVYQVSQPRPVDEALTSIAGAYTAVYNSAPPWQLYDPAVTEQHPDFAPLVNTLTTLSNGTAYWIHATQTITPYLGVPVSRVMIGNNHLTGYQPPLPAVYFGLVMETDAFTPTVGLPITATIGGQLCGVSDVRLLPNQQLAYHIQVAADQGNGCGLSGRMVNFQVGGQTLPANSRLWDNRQANYQLLGLPNYRVYLPLVLRGE